MTHAQKSAPRPEGPSHRHLVDLYVNRGCTVNEAERLIKQFHPNVELEPVMKSTPGDFWQCVKQTRAENPRKSFSECVEIAKRAEPSLHLAALQEGVENA